MAAVDSGMCVQPTVSGKSQVTEKGKCENNNFL